ncbi:MAG: hypothetical protein FXF47_09120 [Candidatus Mcinerneyibacterium aminivorans]|uniref:Uncharacterized protein n=1 Tax=Candidatus Mcinerneyibacterium aminivorans TaxID=2703815 RepID=A0A5D0M9N2_9BACT|nr:MAG: hypothetical protein FXF47_09120 [Candidatus Mcinerneyibacterium aminivorans]
MKVFKFSKIIIVLMLLIGIFELPYGYYRVLRLITFFVCAYGAYFYHANEFKKWTVYFGIIALIFNPFFPVELFKAAWIVIDLLTTGFIFYSINIDDKILTLEE